MRKIIFLCLYFSMISKINAQYRTFTNTSSVPSLTVNANNVITDINYNVTNASRYSYYNSKYWVEFKYNKESKTMYQNLPINASVSIKVEAFYMGNVSPIPNKMYTYKLNVTFDPTNAKKNKYLDYQIIPNTAGVNFSRVKYTILSLNNIPPNLQNLFSLGVKSESQYIAAPIFTSITNIVATTVGTSKMNVSWAKANSFPVGCDEYDFEWAYIDGMSTIPPTIDDMTFSRLSSSNSYVENIPLLYSNGSIAFRIREVYYNQNNNRLTGPWTSLQYKAIGSHEPKLNWTSSISFAEDAKHKEVTTYFDGMQRDRQSVTYNTSDKKPIIAENYYDVEGRKSASILPAPSLDDLNIKFYTSFNVVNSTLKPFQALDFSNLTTCASLPNSLSMTKGAAKYFSPNNTLKNTEFHSFIPDAGGYPISTIEYTNDNTGRIRRQSGVGANFQFGTGKESRYYYGKASTQEIDRLFGTDVGYSEHYFKNMTVDPNGQVSISYIDMSGKTIATSLAGEAANSTILKNQNNVGNYPLMFDLIKPNSFVIDPQMASNYGNASHLVSGTQTMTFYVSTDSANYSDTCKKATCSDCYYDMTVDVKSKCVPYAKDTSVVYRNYILYPSDSIAYDTSCTSELKKIKDSFSLLMPTGEYYVSAKVSIPEKVVDYYTDRYLEDGACFPSLDSLIRKHKARMTPCISTCKECTDYYGNVETTVSRMKAQLKADGQTYRSIQDSLDVLASLYESAMAAKDGCKSYCENKTFCDVVKASLIADVSPGGQYAMFFDTTNTAFYKDSSWNSVVVVGKPRPHWALYSSEVTIYKRAIFTFKNITKKDGSRYDFNNADDLKELSENWNDDMAEKLLEYHPEYCYYKYCVDNSNHQQYYESLNAVETWDEAVAKGYITTGNNGLNLLNSATALLNKDPYFNVNASNNGPISPKNNYGTLNGSFNYSFPLRNVNGYFYRFLNIFELAVIYADFRFAVLNPNGTISINLKYLDTSACSGVKNMIWTHLKNLYKQAADQQFEFNRETACPNVTPKYIGRCNKELSKVYLSSFYFGNPIVGNYPYCEKMPRFFKAAELKNNFTNTIGGMTPKDLKDKSAQDSKAQCNQNCDSMSQGWIANLTECQLKFGKTIQQLKSDLVKICQSSCGEIDYPFGSRSTPSGVSVMVNGVACYSFQDVVDQYYDPTVSNNASNCSASLIKGLPYNYKVAPYFEKRTLVKKDSCVCSNIDKYIGLDKDYLSAFNDLKVLFGAEFDMSQESFRKVYHLCNNADTMCEYLDEPVAIPVVLDCYTRLNCKEVRAEINAYKSKYPYFNDKNYKNKKAFEGYMNAKYSMHILYEDYINFVKNDCKDCVQDSQGSDCDSFKIFLKNFVEYKKRKNQAWPAKIGNNYLELTQWINTNYSKSYTTSDIINNMRSCLDPLDTLRIKDCDSFLKYYNSFVTIYNKSFNRPFDPNNLSMTSTKFFVDYFNGITNANPKMSLSDILLILKNCGVNINSKLSCDEFMAYFLGAYQKDYPNLDKSKIDIVNLTKFVSRQFGETYTSAYIQELVNNCIPCYFCPPPPPCPTCPDPCDTCKTPVPIPCVVTCDMIRSVYSKFKLTSYYSEFKFSEPPSASQQNNFVKIFEGYYNNYSQDNNWAYCTVTDIQMAQYIRDCLKFGIDYSDTLDLPDLDSVVLQTIPCDSLQIWEIQCGCGSTNYGATPPTTSFLAFVNSKMRANGSNIVYTMADLIHSINLCLDCDLLYKYQESTWCQNKTITRTSIVFKDSMISYMHSKGYTITQSELDSIYKRCFPDTILPEITCDSLQIWEIQCGCGSTNYGATPPTTSFLAFVNSKMRANGSNIVYTMADLQHSVNLCMNCDLLSSYQNSTLSKNRGMTTNSADFLDSLLSYMHSIGLKTTRDELTILYDKCFGRKTQTVMLKLAAMPVNDMVKADPISCQKYLYARPLSPKVIPINTCEQQKLNLAISAAMQEYQRYREEAVQQFRNKYIAKCLSAAHASVSAKGLSNEFQYTLYYYGQDGNLLKTVPPAGVVPYTATSDLDLVVSHRNYSSEKVPSHSLATSYKYNSLNQVYEQQTPDAGTSRFVYDELGRLILSQNAQQALSGKYSYTIYDLQSRIVESGEIQTTSTLFANSYFAPSYITYAKYLADIKALKPTATLRYVTRTYYDRTKFPRASAIFDNQVQENLRKRIVSITLDTLDVDRGVDSSTYHTALHYSYDILGNVKSLVSENKLLPIAAQQFKKIDYDYDLVSGKVNKVYYQRGKSDQYLYRYVYDADNRILEAHTSSDDLYWEKDASYQYYFHGPLARTELGKDEVQGIDYAYTLQGWLKSVNASTLNTAYDMGRDGDIAPSLGLNATTARDALAFSLRYFQNDYQQIGRTTNKVESALPADMIALNLYNGNISSQTVSIKGLAQPTLSYQYRYDQLQRLVQMDAYKAASTTTTNDLSAATQTTDYRERVAYDPNGNILSYARNKDGGVAMDQLSYNYDAIKKNQLKQVQDAVADNVYAKDIDHQTNANNYQYDAIGNLIRDEQEQMDIAWTPSGKIASIYQGKTQKRIVFAYDPMGQRISKTVIDLAGKQPPMNTYYTRDAQGNSMAVYDNHVETTAQTSCAYDDATVTKIQSEIYTAIDKCWSTTLPQVETANKCIALMTNSYTEPCIKKAFEFLYSKQPTAPYGQKLTNDKIYQSIYNKKADFLNWDNAQLSDYIQNELIVQNPSEDPATLQLWAQYFYDLARYTSISYTTELKAQNYSYTVAKDTCYTDSLYWQEQHLYGSSRLGMAQPKVELSKATLPLAYGYDKGDKLYELTNHLGNVLATIKAEKKQIDANSDGTVDYYEPILTTATDYYPFGMPMPGRHYPMANCSPLTSFYTAYRINDQFAATPIDWSPMSSATVLSLNGSGATGRLAIDVATQPLAGTQKTVSLSPMTYYTVGFGLQAGTCAPLNTAGRYIRLEVLNPVTMVPLVSEVYTATPTAQMGFTTNTLTTYILRYTLIDALGNPLSCQYGLDDITLNKYALRDTFPIANMTNGWMGLSIASSLSSKSTVTTNYALQIDKNILTGRVGAQKTLNAMTIGQEYTLRMKVYKNTCAAANSISVAFTGATLSSAAGSNTLAITATTPAMTTMEMRFRASSTSVVVSVERLLSTSTTCPTIQLDDIEVYQTTIDNFTAAGTASWIAIGSASTVANAAGVLQVSTTTQSAGLTKNVTLDKDVTYTFGYSFDKGTTALSANNYLVVELIQGNNTLYTKNIMATENGTFSYKPTTSGTYTWSFRMKNSGTVAQPASVCYLDNLQVSYPYPYTRIDCDKGQNASYRYGFNGKENDMETGTQDYGFRIYNPQLGKFLSVDPLTKKYPELTPYQFASNTPIQAIDLDGLEAFDVNYISGTKNTPVISSVSINNNAPFNNGCVNFILPKGVGGSETELFCTSVPTITPFAGTNMITFPTISGGTATSAGNFITSSINNVLAQRIASSPIGSTTTTNVQKRGTINVHGQIFRTSFTVNETAVLTGINPQVDVQLSARNINSPTFQSIQSAVCSQNYNTTITTTNTSVIGRVPGIIDPQNRGGIGVQAQIDLNKSYTDSNGNSTKSYDVPCVESVTHPASGQTITNPSSCP